MKIKPPWCLFETYHMYENPKNSDIWINDVIILIFEQSDFTIDYCVQKV